MILEPFASTRSYLRFGRNAAHRGFVLDAAQFLPQPRERLFEFFSDAFELEGLTPAWLNFRVATPAPIELRAGARIDYRLRLRGIPLRWQSLISVWEPPLRFVDEQTRGPYRLWRHAHVLEKVDGGTLCRDRVEYDVYGGRWIESLLVRRDLRKIFEFRQRQLAERFGR